MISALTFPIKLGLMFALLYTLGGGFTLFSPAQFIGLPPDRISELPGNPSNIGGL